MKKKQLDENLTKAMTETRECLQELWSNINHGQQKQILKNPNIKAMFDRYEVSY